MVCLNQKHVVATGNVKATYKSQAVERTDRPWSFLRQDLLLFLSGDSFFLDGRHRLWDSNMSKRQILTAHQDSGRFHLVITTKYGIIVAFLLFTLQSGGRANDCDLYDCNLYEPTTTSFLGAGMSAPTAVRV